MILFPRPRIFYVIALALAIPTYGVSLILFYTLLKRPYDSRATSLILATAKRCLQTGRDEELFHINRAAIERVFSKFSVPELELKYGPGVAFIRWGVLRHPMINGEKPFSLRVTRNGGNIKIEASAGEVWWLLQDAINDNVEATAESIYKDPEDSHIRKLILKSANDEESIEIPNLKYSTISDFAEKYCSLGIEWFPNYIGMRFWMDINSMQYFINVSTIAPAKKDDSGVSIFAQIDGTSA